VGVFLFIPYTKLFYPKNKTFFCGIKNYFQALKIYNQALKIYNQALKIHFQALKIIINIGIRNFMSVERKLFPSGKKRKLCFHFVFPSLIRTFAPANKIYFINSKYGKCNQIT
jgi:hypothetical protein